MSSASVAISGLFVAPFYHFFVHDTDGPVGKLLRNTMPIAKIFGGMDDKTFACCFVSLFMQITGILQMPHFLGPSFTPFGSAILSPFFDPNTWTAGKYEGSYAAKQKQKAAMKQEAAAQKARSAPGVDGEGAGQPTSNQQKKKKRSKNKKKTS